MARTCSRTFSNGLPKQAKQPKDLASWHGEIERQFQLVFDGTVVTQSVEVNRRYCEIVKVIATFVFFYTLLARCSTVPAPSQDMTGNC